MNLDDTSYDGSNCSSGGSMQSYDIPQVLMRESLTAPDSVTRENLTSASTVPFARVLHLELLVASLYQRSMTGIRTNRLTNNALCQL